MAAVIGLLDILICDDCLTNEQYATVTQIRKCSTALLRLLNNILDLSKVRCKDVLGHTRQLMTWEHKSHAHTYIRTRQLEPQFNIFICLV